MRRRGVQRSRGGATTSSFWKVCGFAVHTRMEGLRFLISPPYEPVSKKCVSGSIWTIGQNNAIHVRFRKRVLSSGWGLRFTVPLPSCTVCQSRDGMATLNDGGEEEEFCLELFHSFRQIKCYL